ncbi:MAG: LysR family transcriptional regulator [Bradyrhizobiaceae bacterium]|nr:MAG: LysR family transcriptional regulator [Bradyrhizobiaceae bacterium]
MARRLPPLSALRAFEVAARAGSFTAAASELGVTHGAVSKHIQALEIWLGRRLFRRSGQRMIPTLHGQAFAREISSALDQIVDASRRFGSSASSSVLQVNAPATFAMRWLVPRLHRFYEQRPRAEVCVSTSTTTDHSLTGHFDIIIRRGPEQWDQFESLEFLRERNTLIASPALLRKKPLKKISDISQHTLLLTDSRPGDWESWLKEANFKNDFPVRRQSFDHFFVTLQAALDGVGLAIGPFPVLAEDVEQKRLVTPFRTVAVPRKSYFVLIPKNADQSPLLKAFVNWLIAEGQSASRSRDAGRSRATDQK